MKSLVVSVALMLLVGFVAGRIEFDLYKDVPENVDRAKRDLNFSKNKWTNDSVVLFKFLNGEYYGLVGVGSPAKTFKVVFDTTWTHSWLPSSHCGWNEIACNLHTKYDSSASSSYIPPAEQQFVNITDNEFSLVGLLATDTYHLPHIMVVNQTFIEATHLSLNPFLQYRADGVVGLAQKPSTDIIKAMPFMYNMIRQKVILENVFTFYMNRDESTSKAGKVILGGRQRTHVKNGTITKLNVLEKHLWRVRVDSIFAEKNKTSFPISGKCDAIFDSSSNKITGPPEAVQKLNYMLNAKFVPGLNLYTVNCRQYAKLPSIHFEFSGNEFIIQSKYYVQRLTLDSIEACFSPFVPSQDPTADYWQLGGAFMMEFYTEFDLDNNIIMIGETIF